MTHPNDHISYIPGLNEGLTKREYFAAMAMQGILSNQGMIDTEEWICRNSVRIADALINALNETK